MGQSTGQWEIFLPDGTLFQPLKLTSPPAPDLIHREMTAIHALLLPTVKVLCVDFLSSFSLGDAIEERRNRPDVIEFNPITRNVSLIWEANYTVPLQETPNDHRNYCSGHTSLSDGRILFRGGNAEGPGNIKTTLFDPFQSDPLLRFVPGPDEVWCHHPNPPGGNCDSADFREVTRWYPQRASDRRAA